MKTSLLFFVLFLAGVPFAQAQEKRIISLDEAIDLGIKNSKQLHIDQAKVEEASGARQEASEKRLPAASASAAYLRLNKPNFELKNQNNGGGSNSGSSSTMNQAIYGMINFSLPIYNGGKLQYGIESARLLEKAARLDADNDKEEIIQNTIEAFANLFKAGTAVRLVRENLEQSRERVRELGRLEENGLLARNDLLKAQLHSAQIELNLLDAENNLQLATLRMDQMLGLAPGTLLTLDTAGIDRPADGRILDDYLKAAIDNRKDMAAIDLRKQAAESGVKISRAEKYPGVQLTGGFIAADVPGVFSVTNAVNVGVGLSYNIASLWKSAARVKQSEARVRQAREAEAQLADDVRMHVNQAYLSLMSNRKKISVYATAREQADENYRIVKNKFDNSLATTSDLLEADVTRFQASLGYTLARADAFVAYNKLLQVSGLLAAERKK